jgi:regulator of sirC expression with transglutaminase-like and TPR domain
MDLEKGVFLLSRTQYPDISFEGYQALLDEFAGDLSRFSHGSHNVENILGGINHYLFTHLGFSGNEDDYYDPDNNFLNRVIDRRQGNPMSLSIIYLLVAKRLKLPVVGIGMPSHFLCRFQTSIKEVYIDAFNRGKILTRADCISFLQQAGYGFKEEFLAPSNSRQILFRVCSNLQYAYNQGQKSTEHTRIQSYLSVLSKK